ncbi:helix-turn-helix domain-containing protein [Parasphingorhabdus litoris]|uniref:Helix-turn-helix domain-containing protein n=1 Tax=Parasphingorhabdus litoris TaxID=394733 RepID=A0ABN1AV10_9SPHN|nr:helix-turn-helix domain-containing protein [Parasphingorhabdus litoris]
MHKLTENLSELGTGCSLPISLEVIGERWCFMILRASFNGVRHFEDFLSEIGIARNILANRLTRLVEAGIMSRRPCDHDKRKVEYRLTDKGADLLAVIVAIRQWGEKWETGVRSNPVLADAKDRQPISQITIRAHDDRILGLEDLCWIDEAELESHARDDSKGASDRGDMVVRHLKEIGEPSAA